MKRIISVLIIAVMLFASLMNVIPAFAEDIELNDKNDVTVDINAIEARLVLEKAIKSAQPAFFKLILTEQKNFLMLLKIALNQIQPF